MAVGWRVRERFRNSRGWSRYRPSDDCIASRPPSPRTGSVTPRSPLMRLRGILAGWVAVRPDGVR